MNVIKFSANVMAFKILGEFSRPQHVGVYRILKMQNRHTPPITRRNNGCRLYNEPCPMGKVKAKQSLYHVV
jgi:hypothetical protein